MKSSDVQQGRPRASGRRPLLPWACACLLVAAGGCPRPPGPGGEEDALRRDVEKVAKRLDSRAYARDVTWGEHVVLSYRLARGRDPTAVEFDLLARLRDEFELERSDVLAVALAGEGETEAAPQAYRGFRASYDRESFRPDASVRAAARQLEQTPAQALALALESSPPEPAGAPGALPASPPRHASSAPGETYRTYFGFLHAHSHLSDGEGEALEAYEYARDQGRLDFFALTDHGILLLRWPWDRKWQRLKEAAEATHADGSFVALWGFEWSNPVLGHVSVLNSEGFTHVLARPAMADLYRWLEVHPDAFARFNHPGRYGLSLAGFEIRELDHLELHPGAVRQMVGLELWNKDGNFDRYFYAGSWNGDPASYFDRGIRNGWQLGALGGQDNHSKEWGTRNDYRTAVLATELTREALIEAYAKRRIYATEDKDLYLDVRVAGFPMGSHVVGVEPIFEVTARDGGGDHFERVRLVRNGVELEAREVAGTEIAVTFTDPAPTGADYYYVIVTQSDDGDGNGRNDEAISSPIWIDASP